MQLSFVVCEGYNESGKIKFYLCDYLSQVSLGPNA